MKQLFTFLFSAISIFIFAQAPQSIPYQAVVRNTDGTMMANTAMTITFKIHDNNATGTVVYEETHATTTNAQGLVSLNVGGGAAVTGTFSGIPWGTGSKFLHVLMNAGNGLVDLGTQQMMSVPYALYSNDIYSRVSLVGDTLFIGSKFYIISGISADNPQPLYVQGQGVTDIDGNFYPSIIINGQEWMQKNLAVSKYRNGDEINTGLSNSQWNSANYGAYAIYNDDVSNNDNFGKLYNWYVTIDSRGVCPVGWRVPSERDWNGLVYSLDFNADTLCAVCDQSSIAGQKIKSDLNEFWLPGATGNNTSGFTALPGGARNYYGLYLVLLEDGYWWSLGELNDEHAWFRAQYYHSNIFEKRNEYKQHGFSIRCIKD